MSAPKSATEEMPTFTEFLDIVRVCVAGDDPPRVERKEQLVLRIAEDCYEPASRERCARALRRLADGIIAAADDIHPESEDVS
jgi:hypothetical protein